MSLLWAVPPLAAATAMIVVIVGMRTANGVLGELAGQLERLGEVRTAVAALREEREGLDAAMERLRR
jgi:hypothetical protein